MAITLSFHLSLICLWIYFGNAGGLTQGTLHMLSKYFTAAYILYSFDKFC